MEDTNELLVKLHKKVDKLNNIVTKIAKTLHLIPVTEKEERDIQILQRTNLKIAAKVNDDLNAMENRPDNSVQSIFSQPEYSENDLFSAVLADDFLGGVADA
jgi:hypothetical protein